MLDKADQIHRLAAGISDASEQDVKYLAKDLKILEERIGSL